MSSDAAAVAREIADVKRRVAGVERASQMKHRSVEDGAVAVYDADGSLRALVGMQDDGTAGSVAVNAPAPPTPSAPVVTAVMGGLRIAWGGTFADALVAPLDWSRVEVHVSTTSGFVPDSTTLRGTIETPQGAELLVPLPYSTHYARLVSRNTSGTASAASTQASGIPLQVQDSDIAGVSASKLTIGTLPQGGGVQAGGGTGEGSLVLDPAGLRLYAPDGSKTVDMHTTTGDVELVGHLTGGSVAIAVNDSGTPYYQDFSAVTAGTVPGDWTLQADNANPSHTSVVTTGFPTGVTGGRALQIDTAAATADGGWFYRLPVGTPTDVLVEGRFAVSVAGGADFCADDTFPAMVRQESQLDGGGALASTGDAIYLHEQKADIIVRAALNDSYSVGESLHSYPSGWPPYVLANTWYRYEIEVIGSSIYHRVWQDGTTPPAPTLDVDSSVANAGHVTVGWMRDTRFFAAIPRQVWLDWIKVTPKTVGFRVDTLGQMSAASPATIGGQVVADSGWVTGTSAFTPEANCTVNANTRLRKYGSLCSTTIDVTWTGATITSSATGDLTNTIIGTVTAGYRPSASRLVANFRVTSKGSGTAQIDTAGVVQLLDLSPNTSIVAGDYLVISDTYFTD